MTPDEHVDQALRLAGATLESGSEQGAQVGALLALVHAVLALRPAPVEAPAVPEMWLDRDGDVWTEIEGCMVMLDREAGEWDQPGLYARTGIEKNYGPLRPVPTKGAPS